MNRYWEQGTFYMGSSNRPNTPTGPHDVCQLRDMVAYTTNKNKRKRTKKVGLSQR